MHIFKKFLILTLVFVLFNTSCNEEEKDDNNGFNNGNNQNNIVNPDCDVDADDDEDTISNGDEGCLYNRDSDNDGFPDYKDVDSDNDGIDDRIEAGDADLNTQPPDLDGDGKPNYIDTDSDGDGVMDGDEDRNGDGFLGTCKKTCVFGSEIPEQMCGPGQFCLGNGNCSPAVSFECSKGETDPLNRDTDGDGVEDGDEGTFVCNPADENNPNGRRPVKFQEFTYFKLGIEEEAVLTNVLVNDPETHEEIVCHDLTDSHSEVAGFTLSKEVEQQAGSPIATVEGNFTTIKTRIENAFGVSNVTMRASGSKTLSHEEYQTVVNAVFVISSSLSTVSAVRNKAVRAIMNRNESAFQNMPADDSFGNQDSNFILSIAVQKTEPLKMVDGELVISDSFLIVQGGVGRKITYEDSSYITMMNLDDLSNSTGFAGPDSDEEAECEPYSVGNVPVADIIWVIDESGSMYEEQTSVANNAVNFFNRAISYGLDFRMGVVGVGRENNGALCTGQGESGDYFLTPADLSRFQQCVLAPWGGGQEEGGSEYGITQGYNAIINHLPRMENMPTRIRPDATLVVIYVSDERAEELKESCGASEGGGMDNIDPTCMWNQIGPTVQLLQGVSTTGGIGKAHAIIGPPPGGCDSADQVGQGYLDIAQYMGGQIGSICQADLGPTLQVIIEDIVASASPVRLAHFPISLSIAVAKDGTSLPRSRVNGFDYRASSNAVVFIGQEFDPNHPSEVLVSYHRWVTDVVPVD